MSLQPIITPVSIFAHFTDRFSQNAQPITVTSALLAGVALIFFEAVSWVAAASVVSSVGVCYLASRYIQVIYPGASPSAFGLSILNVVQKVWQFVQSVFTWITTFFKGEVQQPVQPLPVISDEVNRRTDEEVVPLPVLPVPEGELNRDPLVEHATIDLELALVVPDSQPPLARCDRLNLQRLAQRIQWIRPQDVPLDLRAGLPPLEVAVGVLNLPRAMYDVFIPRVFGSSGLPLLAYSQDAEPPSFLFDYTLPLAELENRGELSEVEEVPISLEDSLTASWVKVPSAEDPIWCERRREELGFVGHDHLLLYLRAALSNTELKDSDPIIFSEGEIRAGSSKKSREVLHLLIEKTYGSQLAYRVAAMECLFAESAPPLTWQKAKEVMVAVAAQVRSGDLSLLFRKVKGEPVEGILCAEFLKLEEKELLSTANRFEELKPEHIQILERAFRTVLVKGEAIPTLDAFFPGSKKYPQGFWSSPRFIANARIVQALGYVNALDPSDISLATAEYLGKTNSYLILEEGMVLPLPSCTNERIYFNVEKVFKKEGVVFQILTPVSEGQHREDELKTLYLNFRGTQARLSIEEGAASVLRDLDWRGIGANFNDADVIDALTPHVTDNQVLKINAHSLGTVDAVRALVAILEAIDQGRLPCLKKIEVFCFNSPAPEYAVNERCKQVLQSLQQKEKLVNIDLTYVRFESDLVQQFGDVFVGAGNTSELLNVRVVNFSSEQIRALQAHGAIACNNMLKSAEFQKTVIDCNTPDGLLEKILSHRYYWDAKNSSFVSRTGDIIQWYGGALGQAAIAPLRFLVYEGGRLFYIFVNFFTPDAQAAQLRREIRDLNRINRNFTSN